MEFDTSIFKKHPVITVAVFAVAAFVFYEIALAPSGSGGAVTVMPPAQNDLAGAGQQSYTAQAAYQANQITAALSANAQNIAGQEYIAKLGADVSLAQISAATGVNTTNAGMTQTIDLAGLTTQQAISANNNETAIKGATITSDLQKALATISASMQEALATTQSQTVLGLGAQQSDTTKTLATIQGTTTVASINASRDIAVASAQANKTKSILGFAASILPAFF